MVWSTIPENLKFDIIWRKCTHVWPAQHCLRLSEHLCIYSTYGKPVCSVPSAQLDWWFCSAWRQIIRKISTVAWQCCLVLDFCLVIRWAHCWTMWFLLIHKLSWRHWSAPALYSYRSAPVHCLRKEENIYFSADYSWAYWVRWHCSVWQIYLCNRKLSIR